MRILLVGAGSLAMRTAALLIGRGHEVVAIERDKQRIDAVRGEIDCGFLLGDGTRPKVLRESDPAHVDVLLCLTGDDQTNIIAALVGRSLGIERVVTRVDDEELEHICIELGLQDIVIPSRTIAGYLADGVEGKDILELSAAIKGEARVFVFVAPEDARLSELDLPQRARVTHVYRDGEFALVDADERIRAGDEVVVVTHSANLPALRKRFGKPRP